MTVIFCLLSWTCSCRYRHDFVDGDGIWYAIIVNGYDMDLHMYDSKWAFVRDSILLYRTEAFYSSESEVGRGWLTWTCWPAGKVCRGHTLFVKVAFVSFFFVTVFDNFSLMAVTWDRIFWRRALWLVVFAASSGKDDWLTAVVDPEGCLKDVFLKRFFSWVVDKKIACMR